MATAQSSPARAGAEPPGSPPPAARRGRLRRALRGLSAVLMMAGTLLIADAGLTVVWQEPVSALYARLNQEALAGRLDDVSRLDRLQASALASLRSEERRIAFVARAQRRRADPGDPIGRLRAPRMGADVVVVEGTGTDDLRQGPGHYPKTSLPGLPGTVAVAGHRTTYGAPFRQINRMRPGDEVVLEMPYGRFVYRTERVRIVPPTAGYVTRDVGHDQLVLTACHPLYSAAQRIVLFARLDSAEGRGTASFAAAG